MAFPPLVLFLTVRREVLAVQDWISRAVAPLGKLEMSLLTVAQVTAAFAEVGLRTPKNPELVRALRNPFVLSLYAGIVTRSDLPLEGSGEVTAFRVVEEFWQRRVRSVSVGQRAVGPSELSQEPKRKAVELLARRTLAGEISMSRARSGRDVSRGIEMLRREGVLEERGPSAVAWVHDWLREYAIISRLLSELPQPTAARLAERVSACSPDHVARAASAGGIKWVLANPDAGRPEDYLSELGRRNTGLMRDALAIVLEGPSEALKLAELPGDLLHEAITLASHMGAVQWAEQIANLPDTRFAGGQGDELHAVVVHYEVEIAPGTDPVNEVVGRDLGRWRAGRLPQSRTFHTLLKAIDATRAFRDPLVREWITVAAGRVNDYASAEIVKLVAAIVKNGHADQALPIFRAVVGLDNPERGDRVIPGLVERHSLLQRSIQDLLSSNGLLAEHPATWGTTTAELLGRLLMAGQAERWPSTLRMLEGIAEATNGAPPSKSFVPAYDEDPRIWSVGPHRRGEFYRRVADSLEAALNELATLPNPTRFQVLAERLLDVRFAPAVVIPLFVLTDAGAANASAKPWHAAAAATLLCDERVASLNSLAEVRRLLRRRYSPKWRAPRRRELVDAIRRYAENGPSRIRELSDCRQWNLLTRGEERAVAAAVKAGRVEEPEDIRKEQLFSAGRWGETDSGERPTGWPCPEDEQHVRILEQMDRNRQAADQGNSAGESLDKAFEALRVVVGRAESRSERWLGTVLGWCHTAVSNLRAALEGENDE